MKKIILKIVPLIITGIILYSSAYLFNINRNQTYERVRLLKESQVQVIATQMDTIVARTKESLDSDPVNEEMMIHSVESINEQSGVYCYLFNKDCELLSNFSKQQKREIGEQIINALREQTPNVLSNYGFHGYITIDLQNQDMLIYWQGIPSGLRSECEYFVILAVNKQEVQTNEAIISCKIMIGILTIMLCGSLYLNSYHISIMRQKE